MEVLNLIRLFWGWVSPYISLTYSLYRWVHPFDVPEMFGDVMLPSPQGFVAMSRWGWRSSSQKVATKKCYQQRHGCWRHPGIGANVIHKVKITSITWVFFLLALSGYQRRTGWHGCYYIAFQNTAGNPHDLKKLKHDETWTWPKPPRISQLCSLQTLIETSTKKTPYTCTPPPM